MKSKIHEHQKNKTNCVSKKLIFSIIAIAAIQISFSQKKDENIGSEVVNIVKPYTPTISDAFKVKQTPAVEQEVVEPKIPIKFQIFSFPVASTFIPSKGKAADVDKEILEKGFSNYVSLGAGTYGTANAEVFLTHQISKTDYIGGMLQHLSSQGGIGGVILDNNFYSNALDATYGSRNKKISWNADLGIKNQGINWYGLPNYSFFDASVVNKIDEKQVFNTIAIGGKITAKDGFFKQASIQFKRFSDAFGSAENRFFVKPNFDFEIMDSKIQASFVVDYVGGNFKKDYNNVTEMKYSNMIFGTKPSFLYQQDDFSLHLGAGLFYTTNKFNGASDGKFFVYPNIKASYRLVGDLMIAYAGAEGNLQQNSYADLVDENPFVSPTLFVSPTDNSFDVYVGMKGKLANAVSFNVRGGMNNEKNKPFFVSNIYDATIVEKQGYHYGNSFNVVYDNLNTFSLFGEIKADFSKKTSLALSGTYNTFKVSNLQEAWNLPQLKVESTLSIDLTEKWYGGMQLFFVGERVDFVTGQDKTIVIPTFNQQKVTLDSYFDLNAHVGYKFSKRLNFFLKGNNLANQQYNRWANFPVQGLQILGGATYKFDF
ncbi:TonB-dependent receptor [Flavobacterium sp.]|uniref:TonB-dependent receptor n=1 Tax=Flavobacterium sp. TaxID=239 RepID=UPI00333F850C